MRCKTAVKFLTDFVDGTISRGRGRRLGGHLATCECCREEEELHRLVAEHLNDVPELPVPEDGLHRLETRLAFLPPRPVARPAGRLRTFALPYAAGLATAAALILLVLPMFAGSDDRAGTPEFPAANESETAGGPGEAKPLAGERELTEVAPASRYFVDERGDLFRLPPEFEELLRRGMSGEPVRSLGGEGTPRPVDWKEH